MRYHDTRSFIGEYIKFNRKNITQKEFVYKERHYKQKNHTKNLYIYITLPFLLEIYKKTYRLFRKYIYILKSIGDL